MKKLILALIKLYKYLLSPLLPMSCRFTPSCSEYALDAVNKHGTFKGSFLTAKRLCKCHPFHPGGYDPVR